MIFSLKKLFLIGVLCMCGMITVFSTAQTLGTTLKAKIMNQGTEGNMIIVDAGADTPMFSSLPSDTYDFIKTVPHIAQKDGQPMVIRCLQLASLVYEHFTTVRGVDPLYYHMYDQYQLVEGRLPTGKNEIIVGTLLPAKVDKAIATGDIITFEGEQWTVVGRFEDRLTVMGSGIVARLEDIQKATNRDHISFVALRAESHKDMEKIAAYINRTYDALLMENPEVAGVIVEPEVEYYLHESEALNPLVLFFNLINALYLAVGAMIIYNIMDSKVLHVKIKSHPVSDSGLIKSEIFTVTMVDIVTMSVLGGIMAFVTSQFIGRISINFMMMTFYLEIAGITIVAGAMVAMVLGLVAAVEPARRLL
jgi:ABC-type antimicrobial peptide transport system permease subunit